MQVKIFSGVYGLESDINEWLEDNPDIIIHSTNSSMMEGRFGNTTTVCIFYSEN